MICLGDIHGRFEPFLKQLKKLDITDTTIIQVGDFGIGFERHNKELARLKFLNNSLKAKNIKMYVLRGNHDNPDYFLGDYKYSNLELMQDYSIINLEGKDILILGGAISIDRIDRKVGTSYWPNEKFVLNKQILDTIKNIDIVCSHNSPLGVWPYVTTTKQIDDYTKNDPTLIHELKVERLDFREAYNCLKENNHIKKWVYGHYHQNNKSILDNTEFICLGIDELFELR